MKYLALALLIVGSLAILAFYPRNLATDIVSPSQLRDAAELAQKYPDLAASFAPKIASNNLTRGEFERLELAVEPAIQAQEAKDADEERRSVQKASFLVYWLRYDYGLAWIFLPLVGLMVLTKLCAVYRQSRL